MGKCALVFAGIAAVLVGCSSSEDGGSSGSTTQAAGLSAAYGSNCMRCHGARGEGDGTYPRIPGSKSEAGYISMARSGRGSMPSFSASQISDADLHSDYVWLTTRR